MRGFRPLSRIANPSLVNSYFVGGPSAVKKNVCDDRQSHRRILWVLENDDSRIEWNNYSTYCLPSISTRYGRHGCSHWFRSLETRTCGSGSNARYHTWLLRLRFGVHELPAGCVTGDSRSLGFVPTQLCYLPLLTGHL